MAAPKVLLLADWLDKQFLDPSLTDYRIMEAIGVSNGTFYKLKPQAVVLQQERAEIRRKEIERVNVQGAVEAAEMGLKTKNERLLILQTEVSDCIAELKAGAKELDVYEKVALRKTIKELQSEISKIEGDYAPVKMDNKHSFGIDPDEAYAD